MSFNPLAVILKENKLDGTNYIDWKRNLDIVFTVEDSKFVLTDLCPPKPHEGATEEEAMPYEKWVKADKMSRCYILATMSNILQHQHQSMPTTYDMRMNLKEMFGDQTCLLGKRQLCYGEIYLHMGNATKVAAVAVGDY